MKNSKFSIHSLERADFLLSSSNGLVELSDFAQFVPVFQLQLVVVAPHLFQIFQQGIHLLETVSFQSNSQRRTHHGCILSLLFLGLKCHFQFCICRSHRLYVGLAQIEALLEEFLSLVLLLLEHVVVLLQSVDLHLGLPGLCHRLFRLQLRHSHFLDADTVVHQILQLLRLLFQLKKSNEDLKNIFLLIKNDIA